MGLRCEQFSYEAPCSIDSEGNEICDEEGELYGVCVEIPIECETDEDCPSHLTCVEGASGGFGISGSGMSMSGMSGGGLPSPPPEDAPQNKDEGMICAFIPEECQSDDDCGENFHCENIGYSLEDCAIPEEVCAEGEVCEPIEPVDCGGEEVTESLCVPQEIECDSDSDCPTDWRCQEFEEYSCGSSDIAIDDPNAEEGDDSEDDIDDIPEDDCEEEVRNLCIPAGLYLEVGYSGEPISTTIESENSNTSSPSGEPNEGDDQSGSAESRLDDDNGADAGSDNSDAADSNTDDDDVSEGVDMDSDEEKEGCDASPHPVNPWTLGGFIALGMLFRRRSLLS